MDYKKPVERRNPNLLNHRDTLQTEPVAPQMKHSSQDKPMKVFRVSQVNAAASAVTNITDGRHSHGAVISSPLQFASSKAGGPIRLPSKQLRVVRIAKKKLLPATGNSDTHSEQPSQRKYLRSRLLAL